MAVAIKFEDVSKQYRLGLVSTRTLSHDLNRWWQTAILRKEDPYLRIGETNDRSTKGESEYVWALRNITFDVKQGDVLGIIGKNGAGKSTLLKILSRVTAPTTGNIKAKGRIASLLEVGTGFHPELTGRENIYMNGSIMGMTKAEITRKLDEIVEFAGVARYIDTPVKRFSSGMMVRLGFSVAAHLEPDILVVDEVLAVGDAEFQKKAIGKMQDVSKGEGRTVLFVSHNMASVRRLCNNGVLMEDGSISFLGDIESVIDEYIKFNDSEMLVPLSDRKVREGNQKAKFSDLKLNFKNNIYSNVLQTNSHPVNFEIEVESTQRLNDIVIYFSIYKSDGFQVLHTNTQITTIEKMKLEKGKNNFTCSFEYFPLQIGDYYVNVVLSANEERLDRVEHAYEFQVIENNIHETGKLQYRNQGIILLPNKWLQN